MKTFLAIYTCAENSNNHLAWKQLSNQEQQERMQKGMIAKQEWEAKYKGHIVFEGGPLGERTKKVDLTGIQDVPSLMGAFVMVKASTHEEAAQMFLKHPHFSVFPGDGVDILECTDTH